MSKLKLDVPNLIAYSIKMEKIEGEQKCVALLVMWAMKIVCTI